MALRTLILILVLSFPVLFNGTGSACHGQTFRSDMLEEMAAAMALPTATGDSTYTVRHGNRDVAVRIAGGCTEHIGYRLFDDDVRAAGVVSPQVADFVERYWLSLTLPLARVKTVSRQLVEDRFRFEAGGMESIDEIQRRPGMAFSCNTSPNAVSMTWGDAEAPVCRITFPVNHELILGRRMSENDRRLPSEILAAKPFDTPSMVLSEDAVPSDSIWTLNAGNYLDSALKSDRYYQPGADGKTLEPVFDSRFPAQSLVNLFTCAGLAGAEDVGLSIRHIAMEPGEQIIDTTVGRFVAYCLGSGCEPYAGMIGWQGEGNGASADILVVMVNRAAGYNHVLRVSVPIGSIEGRGKASGRLNAFVPSSNIRNMFKN